MVDNLQVHMLCQSRTVPSLFRHHTNALYREVQSGISLDSRSNNLLKDLELIIESHLLGQVFTDGRLKNGMR